MTEAQPQMTGDPVAAFAEGVAAYVQTHTRYAALTKEEVAAEAVKVVLTEHTAAREAVRLLTAALTDDDLLTLLVERTVLRRREEAVTDVISPWLYLFSGKENARVESYSTIWKLLDGSGRPGWRRD